MEKIQGIQEDEVEEIQIIDKSRTHYPDALMDSLISPWIGAEADYSTITS